MLDTGLPSHLLDCAKHDNNPGLHPVNLDLEGEISPRL
jgi:hypothetical protein